MSADKPRVGLGVIVEDGKGRILVGKRIGSHAPYWSIPGGGLELGETFEQGSKRELKEELDIVIKNLEFIGVTNNLITYRNEGVHFISIIYLAKTYEGEVKIMEPDKCEAIRWVDPHKLPMPHFEASELAVRCYLDKVPYVGISE